MMQLFRTILRAILCLGLFVVHAAVFLACLYLVTAVVVLPHHLSQEKVRSLVVREMETRLPQAQVRLGGAEVAFLPTPHLGLKNLSLELPGNTLVHIRELQGYPDLMSLFSGSPKPKAFRVREPRIVMGVPDRTVSWAKPEDPRGLSVLLSALPEVEGRIEDGEVQIFGERLLHMQNINAELNIADALHLDLRAKTNFASPLNLTVRSDSERSELQGTLRTEELRLELLAPYLPPDAAQWIGFSEMDMETDFSFSGGDAFQAEVRFEPSRLLMTSRTGEGLIRLQSGSGTFSSRGETTSIRLKNLDLAEPRLSLNGRITLIGPDGAMDLDLRVNDADIPSLAAASKGLFPQEEFTKSFSIVRGGQVPWCRISGSGSDPETLADNLTVLGHLVEGRIDLPKPEMELERVRGTFHVVKDALSMNDLSAVFGNCTITSGRAAMGLGGEVDPLSLYLEGCLDLAETRELLERSLDLPELQRELERVRTLQGRANATFSLSKKGEEVQWGVDLEDIDLRAQHSGLPLPLSLSRGGMSFKQNTLRFRDLRGSIGNSTVHGLEGEIRFGGRTDIRLAGKQIELDLQELAAPLKDFPEAAPWREALDSLRGRMELKRFGMRGPLRSPEQWEVNATGGLPGLTVSLPFLPRPLRASAESITGTERNVSWSGLTLAVSETRIRTQGELAFTREGIQSARGSSMQGEIRSPELLDQLYALASVPRALRLKTPLAFSEGRFQWQGGKDFSVRTDFRLAGGTEGHADISRNDSGYHLDRLLLNEDNKVATLKASLQDRFLDVGFEGEVSLDQLRVALRHPGPLHGDVEGDFRFSLELAPFRFVESNGVIRINELDLPPGIGHPYLRLERAHLEGSGERISLRAFRVRVNNRPVEVSGSVDITDKGNILDLKLRTGKLDETWLEALLDTGNNGGSRDTEQLSRIRGSIDLGIGAFRYGKMDISPVRSIVDITWDKITVLISELGLCHLDPLGQLTLRGENMSGELSVHVREKDLAGMISCLGGGENRISGEFALSLRTGTKGESLSELKQNNRGTIRFQAKNGHIYQTTVLSSILALLNTTEILFGKLPDLQAEGLEYNSIDVEGELKGQVLHLKEVIMDGKTLKLAGSGTVDPLSKRLDLIVLVSPLKTVDRIISWIPIVNYILDDTLVTIPFRVTGKMGDPTVVPLSPQAVGSEVFGIMKRTLSLPFKVFQPLMPEEKEENDDTSQ